MKKFFSIICILLVSCFLFAGCGVSGSNTLESVKFTRHVFYVDEGCPTSISYNVYPSTANNFGQASISTSTQVIGTLVDGVLTADSKFKDAVFTVNAGGKTDSCYVVKKRYPDLINLSHANATGGTLVICNNGTTALKLDGRFSKKWVIDEEQGTISLKDIENVSEQTSRIDQNIFNIKLVSSDPSVVEVVDSSKLQIKGISSGEATITAYLVDDSGREKNSPAGALLHSELNVEVIEQANEIMVCKQDSTFVEGGLSGGSNTITKTNPLLIYEFLNDKNENFITNELALGLLEVNILTSKDFVVETSITTKLGMKCVLISVGIKGDSAETEIAANYLDKLLISCSNVLCGNGVGLNRIIALATA